MQQPTPIEAELLQENPAMRKIPYRLTRKPAIKGCDSQIRADFAPGANALQDVFCIAGGFIN